MHLPGSTRARFGIFALLALGSLGLKAAIGPPRDSLVNRDPRPFDRAVSTILHSQGFAITVSTYAHRSDLILARRGDCRIAARDAKWGTGITSVFADDARAIGPVQYFYRGRRYSRPPGLRLRAGRLEFEVANRLGRRWPMPVLVAFAAAPACGDSQFGLADVRIRA